MDELADKVGTTRQTISKLENGKSVETTLNTLLNLCSVFDCELGYLLGEYDCKTRTATDIQKETGLSEKSIDILKGNLEHKQIATFLSDLIENIEDLYFLSCAYVLYKYLDNKNKKVNDCEKFRKNLDETLKGEGKNPDDYETVSFTTNKGLHFDFETKGDADLELFKIQNAFMRFVQRD
jgi:DNA-binding Xre family transcriptional regulator